VFNAIAGSCTVTRSHIPIYFSPTTRGSGFISKVYEIWPGVGFFSFLGLFMRCPLGRTISSLLHPTTC